MSPKPILFLLAIFLIACQPQPKEQSTAPSPTKPQQPYLKLGHWKIQIDGVETRPADHKIDAWKSKQLTFTFIPNRLGIEKGVRAMSPIYLWSSEKLGSNPGVCGTIFPQANDPLTFVFDRTIEPMGSPDAYLHDSIIKANFSSIGQVYYDFSFSDRIHLPISCDNRPRQFLPLNGTYPEYYLIMPRLVTHSEASKMRTFRLQEPCFNHFEFLLPDTLDSYFFPRLLSPRAN